MTTIASQITSLTIIYSTVYSDADLRKHQSSAPPAFVWGIHRDRWIPRTNGQLRGKCFHLMTSSCWQDYHYNTYIAYNFATINATRLWNNQRLPLHLALIGELMWVVWKKLAVIIGLHIGPKHDNWIAFNSWFQCVGYDDMAHMGYMYLAVRCPQKCC